MDVPSQPAAAVPVRKPLMPLDEALAHMLDGMQPVADVETVDTATALGRVLAADLVSGIDVPPADNSAMDGYAVRCHELPDEGVALPVSARIAAGQVGAALQPGTAARIFTGAPIPVGADAVVMQEHTEPAGDGHVRICRIPEPGQNIRCRGEDIAAGSTVLRAGARLTPQALGVAASVGAARLTVRRRPRVALLSTGDELVMPGQPLHPGAIYNSNRYTLRGLIEAAGAQCSDLGIVPDDLEATRRALREAAHGHDVIVSSGGVSVGEADHLRPAVQAEGELTLWQLAIKPGKPLAFGRVGAAAFVGLPGNPVASFVTFLLLVRPLLQRLSGGSAEAVHPLLLQADFEWTRPDPARREFLRARRDGARVVIHERQGSGVLTSAHWADGLVDLAPGQVVQRGEAVPFLPFGELGC
ncbi:MAG: gephyrin-like molybdotransferase Glp [Pseudomonadota bacterium]